MVGLYIFCVGGFRKEEKMIKPESKSQQKRLDSQASKVCEGGICDVCAPPVPCPECGELYYHKASCSIGKGKLSKTKGE